MEYGRKPKNRLKIAKEFLISSLLEIALVKSKSAGHLKPILFI
jgi:hypothetical protein